MDFVMQRDRTVASKTGHSIRFEKGVSQYVPPEMHAEVMAAGAVPTDEIDEKEPTTLPVRPEDPAELEKQVFAAFEQIVLRNERDDFTANGAPHGKTLQRVLGYTVHNKERDAMWTKFKGISQDD